MSTSSVGSSSSAPISFAGLGSGLNTSAIISALMAAERVPVTRMTHEQQRLQGHQGQLRSIQSSLQQLAFAASEFSLPSLFESSQTVTSSEPTRVTAATTTGAGVGGHEVEVTQLANSAQRTFAFTSPAGEDAVTIDGHEYKLKAGGTVQELASAINSDSAATVYAAVIDNGTIAFSNRATGNTGAEFIKVSDTAGALTEKAGTARQGKDAEYKVDGVAGTSHTNTIANAIPGVTLTLNGLTTTGPVTINVQAPGPNASAVEAQVQSFIKLYNSTVSSIVKQLATKPPSKPHEGAEFSTGTLFADTELEGLLNSMRQSMYTPVGGLPAGMASPADVGVGTGMGAGASGTAQSAIEGQLSLNVTKLTSAVQTNPAGVEKMLQMWSQNLQGLLNASAAPGGALENRINGDASEVTHLTRQISSLNETLALREKALQATYAKLEGVMSQNNTQTGWLTSQSTQLTAAGL